VPVARNERVFVVCPWLQPGPHAFVIGGGWRFTEGGWRLEELKEPRTRIASVECFGGCCSKAVEPLRSVRGSKLCNISLACCWGPRKLEVTSIDIKGKVYCTRVTKRREKETQSFFSISTGVGGGKGADVRWSVLRGKSPLCGKGCNVPKAVGKKGLNWDTLSFAYRITTKKKS